MKIVLTPELAAMTNAALAIHFGCTRQAITAARRRAEGLCLRCGKPAVEGQHCKRHALAVRKYNRDRNRKVHGFAAWKPGRRGRPPLGKSMTKETVNG